MVKDTPGSRGIALTEFHQLVRQSHPVGLLRDPLYKLEGLAYATSKGDPLVLARKAADSVQK